MYLPIETSSTCRTPQTRYHSMRLLVTRADFSFLLVAQQDPRLADRVSSTSWRSLSAHQPSFALSRYHPCPTCLSECAEIRFLSLTIASSPENCTSPSVVSQTNSLSNNTNAGGYSTITTSTAVGGGVLQVETRVGGHSVRTSELDNESEATKVEEASRLNERQWCHHQCAHHHHSRVLRKTDEPILHFPLPLCWFTDADTPVPRRPVG